MPKTKSIRVRLTDEEWSQAEVKSLSLFGVNNKSRLIRKLLRDFAGFSPDLTEVEIKEFREAVRQLTGIARNLNQITARINKDASEKSHLTPTYLDQINHQVKTVNESLKRYIHNTVYRSQEIINYDQ